jgi:hypothetical protein
LGGLPGMGGIGMGDPLAAQHLLAAHMAQQQPK